MLRYYRHGILDIPATSDVPLDPCVITPGYGETGWLLRHLAYSLASLTGRRVIAVSFPRLGRCPADRIGAGYPLVARRHASFVLRVLDERGISKVHLVAHSLSGLAGAVAAIERPSRFASVQLVAPAGLLKHDSLPSLINRVLIKSTLNIRDAVRSRQLSMIAAAVNGIITGIGYFVLNPVRGYREACAAASTVSLDWLMTLTDSIPSRLILETRDRVFPLSLIDQSNVGPVRLHEGSHDALYLDPYPFAIMLQGFIEEQFPTTKRSPHGTDLRKG